MSLCASRKVRRRRVAPVQPSLTLVADTAALRDGRATANPLYQMAGTRQSIDGRTWFPVLIAVALAFTAGPAGAASDQDEGSGLPVPRFVSLKSDHVNVRGGPDKDHDVAWVYTRPGLPVEITAEYANWRRIRDQDGTEGWVYHSLLSGKRTAFVAKAKASKDVVALFDSADAESPVRAWLEPGVLGSVKRCNGHWCRLIGTGFDGWIEQDHLWGVYPNEKID
jgi:SH3-like domain-containing protein